MLKKLGIVAATVTAGVIALSPLAFATDKGHHDYHGHPDEVTNIVLEDESVERDQVNVCEFEQEIESAAPIDVLALVTQTQTDNCVNIGDTTEEPEED